MRTPKTIILLAGIILAAAHGAFGRATNEISLENDAIGFQWRLADGMPHPALLQDKLNGVSFPLNGECFQLVLGDGTVLKTSDFALTAPVKLERIGPEPEAVTLSRRRGGWQLVGTFFAANHNLAAEWRALLPRGAAYIRQELTLRALGKDVLIKEIILFDETVPGARTVGTVDGSPVVAGSCFIGYEHPMAQNVADKAGRVHCGYLRDAVLKDGETLTQSFVAGVTRPGQLRRGFLAYIEEERAHPYRPFLHYNSWYDIAWFDCKFNEAQSLDAINQFGTELTQKRHARLDSFLFDDGWDDNRTLWQFHSGFPNGFTPLKEAAAKWQAAPGVWLSPFGGYDGAKEQRLRYGHEQGFETNASGFSLAGPKYYARFHDICLRMIRQYGVNQFKFDGLAAQGRAGSGGSRTRDGDAMLRLIADLRRARPDIYINQTTGTWPSPFWLLYVDSIWRDGSDWSFYGKGSYRQQWITYRDMTTYHYVVKAGPLYPLNSLMLGGIIYAARADHLTTTSDDDFADEVHDYFGTGTQLQEMYITPRLLNARNWDDLAEAANWSRAHASVLVDTHWVGGDPGKDEIYGWASWAKGRGVLTLRNPSDQPSVFTADVRDLFELPDDAVKSFSLRSPWKRDRDLPLVRMKAGEPHTFNLRPFEVLVLETK
jgi:hypothetical protein